MKKLLIVATLSIAVAAVIKRVTGKSNKSANHIFRISGKTIDEILSGY